MAVMVRCCMPDKVSANYQRCTRTAGPLTAEEDQAIALASLRFFADTDGSVLNAYTQERPYPVYKDMNNALRTDTGLEEHGGFIYLIKKAMKNKGKAGWFSGKVFRGMKVDTEALAEFTTLKSRSAFLWAGFVSTTSIRENCFKGNVIFEIALNTEEGVDTIEQTRAVDISKWSMFPKEGEVLLMPYSGLQVVREPVQQDGALMISLQSTPRAQLDSSARDCVMKRRELVTQAPDKGWFLLQKSMHYKVVAGSIQPGHIDGCALRDEPCREGNFTGAFAQDGSIIEVLDVNPSPGGYIKVRTENGNDGWMPMCNAHVQLLGDCFEKVKPGYFVMKEGREMLHGNVRHATGTQLRDVPNNDTTSLKQEKPLLDGQAVIIKRVVANNSDGDGGFRYGYDWAQVALAGSGRTLGWIKAQNLHVQLM